MVLYLDTDSDPQTGWGGFDCAVNRLAPGSLEKWNDGWQKAGEVPFSVSGHQLHLAVPLEIFSGHAKQGFLFKWADNSTPQQDLIEFIDMGDSAPNARFAWRFVPAATINPDSNNN